MVILEDKNGAKTESTIDPKGDRQIIVTSVAIGKMVYEYSGNDAEGRRVYRYTHTEPFPAE